MDDTDIEEIVARRVRAELGEGASALFKSILVFIVWAWGVTSLCAWLGLD